MKKLICLLLILAVCLAAAGCAKEEELCGTPLAPAMMELRGIADYYALKEAAGKTDDELKAFLEEQGYAEGDITDRAQVERCIWLLERVPVTEIDGCDLLRIEVYPDSDWMQVNYCFSGDVTYRYFAKDAEELGLGMGTPNIEIGEELDYHNSAVNFYAAEIDGIPVEITIPENKSIKSRIGMPWLGRAAELWEEHNRIENDPGPPTICEINGIGDYFELVDIAEKPEEEQKLHLEEKGYEGNLIGVSDIDDIIALVERAPVPMIEGWEVIKIEAYPDDTWQQVSYYLSNGMEFTYGLKDVEESRLNTEDIRIEFKEERIYGRKDKSFFSVEIDGIHAEICMPKTSEEDAKKLFEEVRFKRMSELRG